MPLAKSPKERTVITKSHSRCLIFMAGITKAQGLIQPQGIPNCRHRCSPYFSIAEVIYRGFPVEEIVAQACAHQTPDSAKEEQIAVQDYGLKAADLQGEQFNKMRNYLGAQVSMMYANSLSSQPNDIEQLRQLVNALIVK